MTKLDGKTPDLAAENIEQLRQIFPDVFEEGKIDFDKLKQVLGEYVDDEKERYNFTWNGKGKALRLAQTPTTGTLRPCPEEKESKNWDDTQNLYIEGDNLEVLKLLQKSYHGKIKMIYIDPPYNTGSDFVYPDDFSDSIKNYKRITGQVDGDGKPLSPNTEANGRFHTDWLNMMYPRLRLAKNLLSRDGAIFVSIDEHELSNLLSIMNEIFGEENYVDSIVWNKKSSAKGVPPANMMVNVHEYIVVFQKTSEFKFVGEKRSESADGFKNPDNDPRGPWRESNIKSTTKPIEDAFTIVDPSTGKQYTNTWAFSKESLGKMISEGRILWKETLPKQKEFMYELTNENKAIKSYFGVFDAQSTTVFLKKLIPQVKFDNPKPINLMKYLIGVALGENDYVLDFFSGSATTAHAVMQLNAEDGGERKFIMVQLPELCDEDTEAAKAGYKNICEIGKERIRRTGELIKDEVEEQNAQLKIGEEPRKVPDIGFKVFKLDSSNLKQWQPDYENLEATFFDSISNYVDGRSELDVVYEIMLKMGMELTWPLETHTIGGKNVYEIGMGALMICLDDHITTEVAEGMAALYKELAPETWRVVFKDNGFADDSAKVNIKEILKTAGLEEDAFTTV
ncbi:site-specific DNA-methyltransferase [Pseudoflavonifractor capillosus]|uniref:site-specific DNA-methyltransferase n=1 Tax=Pseudoflavonifractor capillosus TaxID=106588 RepID=UPI00195C8BDF|nr:DNA methyltransferase [Pseudoflavonifractor capillosus]MBM6897603.1 site-specific DNA-methyltransferase [Pseudoflavonifractor capillosus]